MVEVGYAVKITKNEELREDLEKALIQKIEDKLIIKAREIRAYRLAIQYGGEPIVKKIIAIKKYTPTQAAIDAGTSSVAVMQNMYSAIGNLVRYGTYLASQKHVVLTETLHNHLVSAQKIVEKLVDCDYAEGRKRKNVMPGESHDILRA